MSTAKGDAFETFAEEGPSTGGAAEGGMMSGCCNVGGSCVGSCVGSCEGSPEAVTEGALLASATDGSMEAAGSTPVGASDGSTIVGKRGEFSQKGLGSLRSLHMHVGSLLE